MLFKYWGYLQRHKEKAPTFVGTFSLLVAEAGFEPTTSGL